MACEVQVQVEERPTVKLFWKSRLKKSLTLDVVTIAL